MFDEERNGSRIMDSNTTSTPSPADRQRARREYWRANLRLISVLLVVWATVSYGCGILFVEWFNQFTIGRLPLGYWFANQGSMYTFVVLIFIYARRMEALDRRYQVED
jgi:putative solute:sodium symporter small subunit